MTATSSRELRDGTGSGPVGPPEPAGAPGASDDGAADEGSDGTGPGPVRRVLGYPRQRYEARKVRRLVRHVDPWSILKLALLMTLCLWVVGLIAAVVVWSVANNTGALDSLERFFNDSLQLEDFELSGDVLFRQFGLVSLLFALGTTATVVVATLVFNLISDIIGGVWISVIEEETARPIASPESADPRSP